MGFYKIAWHHDYFQKFQCTPISERKHAHMPTWGRRTIHEIASGNCLIVVFRQNIAETETYWAPSKININLPIRNLQCVIETTLHRGRHISFYLLQWIISSAESSQLSYSEYLSDTRYRLMIIKLVTMLMFCKQNRLSLYCEDKIVNDPQRKIKQQSVSVINLICVNHKVVWHDALFIFLYN